MASKDEQAAALLAQQHQLEASEQRMAELDAALSALHQHQAQNDAALDTMLEDMQSILDSCGIAFDEEIAISCEVGRYCEVTQEEITLGIEALSPLACLDFNEQMSWQAYIASVEHYAEQQGIDLSSDPYRRLMTLSQRVALEKRIAEEFSLKGAQCDKYDYLIAGTAGVIGGLIDLAFGGTPSESQLTKGADKLAEKAVENFARFNGWQGGRGNQTSSAISYLEGLFGVNYDQATSFGPNGTGGAVKHLSTKNHHLKSLAHSPCLVGLFFSIINQFTHSASFVSEGKLVTISAEAELQGHNFIAKIFCGVANWFGHLMSDVSGSSGIDRNRPDYGRGSGIPIPFYNLLQFMEVGEFGQHRQSFAVVCTKVFEQGYDLRHGLGLCVPVLVTELITRLGWTVKQRCYHQKPWSECVPLASNPELRRMLLVAHGSMCLIDGGEAALRSGGDMVQFLLRTNLVGWSRFGHLALKEMYAWYNAGHIDAEAVDAYLDSEYRAMLASSRG